MVVVVILVAAMIVLIRNEPASTITWVASQETHDIDTLTQVTTAQGLIKDVEIYQEMYISYDVLILRQSNFVTHVMYHIIILFY